MNNKAKVVLFVVSFVLLFLTFYFLADFQLVVALFAAIGGSSSIVVNNTILSRKKVSREVRCN